MVIFSVMFMELFILICLLKLGTVPSELCKMNFLYDINFENNVGITCYAVCMTSISYLNTSGLICPTSQDQALCDLIASTNIASNYGSNQWSCDSSGFPSSDPCVVMWPGLTCSNGAVVRMDMCCNGLSGTIPSTFGLLTSLTYLQLGYNYLFGTIPASLSQLSSIQYLYLYSNCFSGTIPSEVGLLSSLHSVYLGSNHLVGTIPPELSFAFSLSELYLYDNSLTGNIL